FDHYLAGRDTGLEQEAPVHYYAMHAEAWRAAPSWPPAATPRKLGFAGGRRLAADARDAAGTDTFHADFGAGTGCHTRFERLMALDCQEYYGDWNGREDAMLSYTSEPLAA